MQSTFKLRSYGYSELAQLYFPHITKKSASVQLRRWLILNKKLNASLEETGFVPGQKLLTPRQVALVLEFLGEP
jgi:hypothetical protein